MRRNNSYQGSRRWNRDDYYGPNPRAGSQRYGSYNPNDRSEDFYRGGSYSGRDYDGEDRYGISPADRDSSRYSRGYGRSYYNNYDEDYSDYVRNEEGNRYNHGNNSNYGRYERDNDRNFFERAGDRIREKWNDWTGGGDDDRDQNRGIYSRRNDNRDEYESRLFERDGRQGRNNVRDWTSADGRHDDDDYDYRRNYGDTNDWQSHHNYGGSSEYDRRNRGEYQDERRRRDTTANWSGQNRGRTNNYPGYYEKDYSGRRKQEREYEY